MTYHPKDYKEALATCRAQNKEGGCNKCPCFKEKSCYFRHISKIDTFPDVAKLILELLEENNKVVAELEEENKLLEEDNHFLEERFWKRD